MKNALTLAVAMFVAIFIAGCGSGSGTGSDAAIQVIGEVSGLNSSIAANPSNEANFSLAKATFDPDQTNARCPDTDQSNSFTTTPTAYNVLIKKFIHRT